MTEKEKMTLAKKYIDYLARGFNPLDESPVRNDDIVRNERISRCLLYVSDVLGEVIEKGIGQEKEFSYKKPERVKKEEFYLSQEDRKKFIFSDRPLTVTEIATGLSSLRDELRYKDIKGTAINEVLLQMGFLYEEEGYNGKLSLAPTEEGLALGIIREKRLSQQGFAYFVNLFTVPAQQFIIDNLDAVIEHNKVRKIMQKAKRQERKALKKYGSRDIADEIIADLYNAGSTVEEIVEATEFEESAVLARMSKMNII